jgi:Family of unknown function (DUF6166)
MSVYKLDRSSGTAHVSIDGKPLPLFTEIHDTGVEAHGFGGVTDGSQTAFAILYNHYQDLETALAKLDDFKNHFLSCIVPLTVEIDSAHIP